MDSARELLQSLSNRVQTSFREDRALLSFGQWFDGFLESPKLGLRSAAQYLRDVFDHFGSTTLELPTGSVRRFHLFDAPWGKGDGRVAGQERVQNEIYRLVNNFVRDGRVSRLIMLHGPNGSAKSSIIHCLQRAMEAYARTPEGALYRYAWIFPSEKIVKGRLGFDASASSTSSGESHAHLSAEQVDARLPCELRDPPLFLIPKKERARLIEQLRAEGRLPEEFVVSRYALEGDLSPRDRAIYDALLLAHDGDHAEVLRHIQVERFYLSLRYGEGIATVEPQMHVDAQAQQLTADRSVGNLPRPLQNVPMYQLSGPLVSANRGLLEYSDLLKRPAEAYKYLLITSEEATASLPQFKIDLDEVLIASSNEKYLEAFKEHPDWMSFKARIELVRVPYLLRFRDEIQIYADQIKPTSVSKELAPHVAEAAAMWAVLTRLQRPNPEHFPEPVRSIVKRMSPLEKLRLYDEGQVPEWVSSKDGRELLLALPELFEEYRNASYYEGLLGASAREMRTVILNAAHHDEYRTLTPLPVFDELANLIRDPSLYDFLKQEPQNGFHDNRGFVDAVKTWWTNVVDDEVRLSMGLVDEARYEELFTKYVLHASTLLKKEKLFDKVTGQYVDPDKELLEQVEEVLLAENEDRHEFRRSVIGRIGAWSLENSGESPDYRKLFESYIGRLEEDYYSRQKKQIARNLRAVLDYVGEEKTQAAGDREAAETTLTTMDKRFGYPRACTAECAAFLLRAKYAED
ncbi:MAG: serine protein kinase PrkA [Myxococcota bacterium]